MKTIVWAGVFVSMLGLIESSAKAQAPMMLRVAGIPVDVAALSYYADAQGFFKKHGLDVDVISAPNGAAVAAAVAGGALDIGDGNTTSVALAHQGGFPFVFIAPSGEYDSKSPTSALMVLKTSPLKSAKDLVGKVIGVNGIKGISDTTIRAWLEKNGVDGGSVKFLELTYSQMGPALQNSRIDAALVEEPFVATLADANARVFARPYDAIAPEFLEGGFFCTTDFVKAHPDIVKRFADAMAETAVWANSHHPETADILNRVGKIALPPNAVRITYPQRVTPELLQPLLDASARYGLLKSSYPASDIIAPGIEP